MTDQIKPETIKKTQEVLGKFIKKPVLTEKLLMKPPFRFLHDICTAVMRETGFFEGILSQDDCKVENIKDKDGKIAFLQKVIAAVEAANDIKLSVKPNKIVAGHEPTRTNEFLQALGRALEKQDEKSSAPKPKTDSSRRQEKIVESKTKSKTVKRPEKEESTLSKKSSSTKISKTVKTSESKTYQDIKSKSNAEKISPRSKQEMTRKTENKSPKDQETISGKQEFDEGDKSAKRRERNKLKAPMLSNDASIDIKKEKSDQEHENVGKVELDTENKQSMSAKTVLRRQSTISDTLENVASQERSSKESPEPPKPEPVVSKTSEIPPKRSDSSFLRISGQNSSPTSVPPNYLTKDSAEDLTPISRPVTSIRPTTARPASARPAAPRIRDRGEISVNEDVIKQSTGKVHIIPDKKDINEPEEDENVVVVEPEVAFVNDLPDKTDQLESVNDQGEHGLLVEQILETQKELHQSRQHIVDNKGYGMTEIEWKSGRNREAAEREIKKLRLSVQTLTRSANPLGKLLDFLQEDVDIMQKELINWRQMNTTLDVQIAQERSLTDQSIEPLKIHLKELQQTIDDQLNQLTIVKANILRNDQIIHRLLTAMK